MHKPRYRIGTADAWLIIDAHELAALGLPGATMPAHQLRRCLHRLGNSASAQALHALLDQEQDDCAITVQVWE